MNIYLDIETIPGQSPRLKTDIAATIKPPGSMKKAETIAKWEAETKPDAIEAAWRKFSFDGDRGEIVSIAWAVDEEPVQCAWRGIAAGDANTVSESELIETFFAAVLAAQHARRNLPAVYVGHNVRDFDLRFLFQRSVMLRMYPTVALPYDARPGSDRIFDTMEAWAGWRGRISLDRLCKAFDIPTKGSELGGEDIDGSMVWDYIAAGRAREVAEYCKADVERVREVHRRLSFVDSLSPRREQGKLQRACL